MKSKNRAGPFSRDGFPRRPILYEVGSRPVPPPGVLMVTGAYYPEVSGGSVQCRQLVYALADRVRFTVLTTSADRALPASREVDGTPVYRATVNVARFGSKLRAALHIAWVFVRLRRRFNIVHLHGFSKKSALLVSLARLFRKKLVLKLSSVGYDDPHSIRERGRLAFWFYSRADLFVGVSPRLQQLYHSSELPREKFRLIPNGVDLGRFRPGSHGEQCALRHELGLPQGLILILFVGFFSHEKRPDLLFEAWTRVLGEDSPTTGLVFVGATCSPYYEVDQGLARRIRAEAQQLGVEKQVIFVEATHEIEKFYRAADALVLPSTREGLPNVVLEAMASGLPCIVSRLPGVTDTLIADGMDGLLVTPRDPEDLARALKALIGDPQRGRALGLRGRQTVEKKYSIAAVANDYLRVYRALTGQVADG